VAQPALVVHIAALLLVCKIQPIVQSQNLLVPNLRHEDVLETGAAHDATTPGVRSEPKFLQQTQLIIIFDAHNV